MNAAGLPEAGVTNKFVSHKPETEVKMNKLNCLAGLMAMMAMALIGTRVWAQGSLTPPGAPAPTMKTLSEVYTQVQAAEPRIPVARAPVELGRPGSYYLTDNLEGTVTITADDVSLDLMGFTISGAEGGNAITVATGTGKNLRVHNGVLFLPTTDGVGISSVGSGTGLNGRIESLRVTGGRYGIYVGSSCTVRDCQVTGADTGIRVGGNSVVRECRFEGNATGMRLSGTGALVENNIVRGNTVVNYDFVAGNQLNLLLCQIPETLSWPCSAKLAGSFSGVGHGVTITASGVTLDLMGFTLAGDQGTSDYGVYLLGTTTAPIRDVVVRNGNILNFGSGLRAAYVNSSRFEHLSASTNSQYGICLYGDHGQCNGNTIADCAVSGNVLYGFLLDGTYGHCDGNTIAACAVSGNIAYGVYLKGSYGHCDGNIIADCAISGNASSGIYFNGSYGGRCDGNKVAACAVNNNGSYGFYISAYQGQCNGNAISDSAFNGNGFSGLTLYSSTGQCNGNAIADCAVSGNGTYGVYLYSVTSGQCDGNTVVKCAVSGNGEEGVFLRGSVSSQCEGNTIADCVIRTHTNSGIHLHAVEGNCVQDNRISSQIGTSTYGVYCLDTARNLILKNTCVGQATNFIMTANDTYGPIVSAAGALATTGAAAHPWANFSR